MLFTCGVINIYTVEQTMQQTRTGLQLEFVPPMLARYPCDKTKSIHRNTHIQSYCETPCQDTDNFNQTISGRCYRSCLQPPNGQILSSTPPCGKNVSSTAHTTNCINCSVPLKRCINFSVLEDAWV